MTLSLLLACASPPFFLGKVKVNDPPSLQWLREEPLASTLVLELTLELALARKQSPAWKSAIVSDLANALSLVSSGEKMS